jgi:hypothetical protein
VEATVRTRDLVNEYLTYFRRTTGDDGLLRLTEHGIPLRSIRLVRPVLIHIALKPDRCAPAELYQPDPAGKPAWVVPVRTFDSAYPGEWIETADPEIVVSQGTMLDLIAFAPAAPGRWALRLGEAAVLGAIEPQYLDPRPVPVHRDVTDWLRSGCSGIMLLTRDACEAGRILRQCKTVEAQDPTHAAQLRRLIERPPYVDTLITVRPAIRRVG